MNPFGLVAAFDEFVAGTHASWLLLAALLPFAGRAVARTWGPAGVTAARRGLLLLALYLAYALLLALPVHTAPLLLGALPLVGAAWAPERTPPGVRPLAWLGALAFAAPAVTASHLGPRLWAAWWLIALFMLAGARGVVEPLAARLAPAAKRAAAPWRRPAPERENDSETSVK